MTKTEIRAHVLLKGKTLAQLAAEKGTTRQNMHSVVSGRTRAKHWQQVIAEFIEHPVDQVFPVTKEEA